VSESDLVRVLREFGEERYAKRIAHTIVLRRAKKSIETTFELVELVTEAIPKKEAHKHPATRTFQAIRIAVNGELKALERALESSVNVLAPNGRLVVISFHSLEDRAVKRFMRRKQKGDDFPRDMPIKASQLNSTLKVLGKPVRPSASEVSANTRSRSAVMRVAEKLGA
jgi:16S rRNA (cytosine1402-N4)-methyltransferase